MSNENVIGQHDVDSETESSLCQVFHKITGLDFRSPNHLIYNQWKADTIAFLTKHRKPDIKTYQEFRQEPMVGGLINTLGPTQAEEVMLVAYLMHLCREKKVNLAVGGGVIRFMPPKLNSSEKNAWDMFVLIKKMFTPDQLTILENCFSAENYSQA